MKNIPWTAILALFLGLFIVFPYAVEGQQKALTVASLQTTYASDTKLLKQKILNAQAEYKVLNCASIDNENVHMVMTAAQESQCYDDNITISKAQDDLHTLQLSYQLVFDSLK